MAGAWDYLVSPPVGANEKIRGHRDSGQRITQLVPQHRQKFILNLVGRFRSFPRASFPLQQLSTLDRQGGALGHAADEIENRRP